jgi:uncharacterized membrane protein
MAFCGKCGSSVSEGAAFCPQCGAQVGDAVPPPPPPSASWSAAPPPPPQPAQAWSTAPPPPPQPAQSWSTAPPPPPQPGQGWSTTTPPPPPPPGVGAGWASAPGVPVAPASGLQENVAGCLCYALGWLTGIVFLLIDKRPFVRFHAAQSIVVFGALNILRFVLLFGFFGGRYGFFSFVGLLSWLLSVATLIAWLALMAFAYQGKRYEVPVAAGIAKSIAGNPTV